MAKQKTEKTSSFLEKAFSASALMAKDLPDLSYVVDGIIPEGLSLLIAAPKIGKSWMVLGIAVDVALGQPALGGVPTTKAPVLYLALEDGERRLKDRYTSIQSRGAVPSNLSFLIEAKRDDILETIREFIGLHSGSSPLVILDTLGKVMPPQERGETLYDRDYRIGADLKRITDSHPGSAVIVVHHTRKADTADFAEASSGTNGLTGSADTIIILKRDRNESTATLHVTSRDAREGEYQVIFATNGRWTLNGGSLEAAARASVTAEKVGNKGEISRAVIEFVHSHAEGVEATDVAESLNLELPKARVYLSRAHKSGSIRKLRRGLYGPSEDSSTVIHLDFTGVGDHPPLKNVNQSNKKRKHS